MNRKTLLITLLILSASTLFAAATYYDSGSQVFTITAGTNVPLSVTYYDNTEEDFVTKFGPGDENTNLTMGGYGALDYELFVNPYLAMGGELGYQFNFAADGNILSCVPILYRLTYMPIQGTIETPISLGLGFNYMSYNGNSKFTLMGQLNVGARYYFTSSWGVGIQSGISWSPEWYDEKEKNGHITFIPINLTVTYRQ